MKQTDDMGWLFELMLVNKIETLEIMSNAWGNSDIQPMFEANRRLKLLIDSLRVRLASWRQGSPTPEMSNGEDAISEEDNMQEDKTYHLPRSFRDKELDNNPIQLVSSDDHTRFREEDEVTIVLEHLKAVHNRARGYGRSWCKRGEERGILPNIDRKKDRLDVFFEDPGAPVKQGEKKIDTVADLAMYCVMYLAWLREHHYDDYDTWFGNMFSLDKK